MKKRYLMLALVVLILSISFVSASENVSITNDGLAIDDTYLSDGVLSDSVNEDTNNSDSDGDVSDNVPINEAIDNTSDVADDTNTSQNNSGNSSDISDVSKDDKTEDTTPKPVPAKVVTKNIASTYGTTVMYTVKVFDKSGKPIEGESVTVKINGQTCVKYTDSKGTVSFSCNCPAGNYNVKYIVGSITGTNTYKVKNKVTLTILKWGLKGDVSKVKLIKKNMPNNAWVKKAVAATKKGIPLLKFKGGSGKIVFMTAGVHGNELSSQVAAMKMIKYLSDNPIKGTVYIIPFVNVKAISKKVRYTDKDFNRIAAKSGTIPNKIVKLVVKYKCDAFGDFHTTKPGGVPGKNVVMGSKGPATKSAALTNYIVKNCKVNKILYKYAGQSYPGAIADNVNKKGIPAVLCEVMLPHNTVTTKTVNLSYKTMTYLLKYNSII